jgi:glutaredoxin
MKRASGHPLVVSTSRSMPTSRSMSTPMSRSLPHAIVLSMALLLAAGGATAQQMYKWVDAKGVVHFSDQPPPPGQGRQVEAKSSASSGGGASLPFALADAVRKAPVTLYTGRDCNICDQGRALLQARGVPFSEKTVNSNEDIARLAQAGSNGQLPLLLVGRTPLIGFDSAAWDSALSDASYPVQSQLPGNYQQAAATPAAPPRGQSLEAAAAAAARAEAAEAARRQAPPVPPEPDFRF